MAWSWSHTGEAYRYAEDELRKLSKETLAEILAEWKATTYGEHDADFEDRDSFDSPSFDAVKYEKEYALMLVEDSEILAEEIWNRAREQATCDNGGYNAWMCPYGCGPHCVDFGPDDEDEKAVY